MMRQAKPAGVVGENDALSKTGCDTHSAFVAACVFSCLFSAVAQGAEPRPWTHLNFQNDPDDFQFAIVPDRTGGDYRGAFTNALEKVNRGILVS